jgi:hypothetical protein
MTVEEYEVAAVTAESWPAGQAVNWLRTADPPELVVLAEADRGDIDEVLALLQRDPRVDRYG